MVPTKNTQRKTSRTVKGQYGMVSTCCLTFKYRGINNHFGDLSIIAGQCESYLA